MKKNKWYIRQSHNSLPPKLRPNPNNSMTHFRVKPLVEEHLPGPPPRHWGLLGSAAPYALVSEHVLVSVLVLSHWTVVSGSRRLRKSSRSLSPKTGRKEVFLSPPHLQGQAELWRSSQPPRVRLSDLTAPGGGSQLHCQWKLGLNAQSVNGMSS